MADAPTIWRYTCTSCGVVVRVGHQASGIEIASCGCGAEIVEGQEPAVEPGA